MVLFYGECEGNYVHAQRVSIKAASFVAWEPTIT